MHWADLLTTHTIHATHAHNICEMRAESYLRSHFAEMANELAAKPPEALTGWDCGANPTSGAISPHARQFRWPLLAPPSQSRAKSRLARMARSPQGRMAEDSQ